MLLFGVTLAQAEPVRYVYSGVVTEVRDYLGTTQIGDYASLGDRFHGSFYYDADAHFAFFIEPNRAFFGGPQEPNTVTLNALTVSGSSGEVQLFDNYPNYPDNVFLASTDHTLSDLPASLARDVVVTRLNFLGSIENMQLPRTLSLAEFPFPWFSITGYSSVAPGPGNFAWGVHGYLDRLDAVTSTVPEPSSAALALLALVVGVGISARRRIEPGLETRTVSVQLVRTGPT